MAFDNTWNGSTDAWATESNWTGGVPAADGHVIISQTSQAIAGSNQSAVTLDLFSIVLGKTSGRYDGSIGSSGSPMRINADVMRVTGLGDQSLFIDGDFDEIHVDMNNLTENALVLNGVNAGTAGLLKVDRGRVVLGANCTATRIEIPERNMNEVIIVNADGSTITDGTMRGGTLRNSGTITALEKSGGRLEHMDGVITLISHNGGPWDWYGGNITTARHHAGNLDATKGTGTKVISTALEIYNGDADLRDGIGHITGPVKFKGTGRVRFNDGVELTLA